MCSAHSSTARLCTAIGNSIALPHSVVRLSAAVGAAAVADRGRGLPHVELHGAAAALAAVAPYATLLAQERWYSEWHTDGAIAHEGVLRY